jgi:hypothetical protein
MSAWIIGKTPTALDRLWPYIEASAGTRPLNGSC